MKLRVITKSTVSAAALFFGASCFNSVASAGTVIATPVYSYVSSQTVFTATAGQLLTLPVYLKETTTSSSLIASDGGLFGAGFSIDVLTGGSTLTGIAGFAANFPGGGFSPSPSNTSTFLAGDNFVGATVTSGPVPNASGLIEIGTVNVTAGAAGTASALRLANYAYPAATDGYTDTFDNSYNLDAPSTPPAFVGASTDPTILSIVVPGVTLPAPASCGMVLVGVGMLMLKRGRQTV